jgi:hypothetical protein
VADQQSARAATVALKVTPGPEATSLGSTVAGSGEVTCGTCTPKSVKLSELVETVLVAGLHVASAALGPG